ncbi:hypothetical protein N9E28_02100 [Alphaproteobacteria bacterium]|nr:hypothetical protein [Alphaproteobacteria bacterium]
MPNLADFRLLAVFIFHKTGGKVVLTERQNQSLLSIASTLRQGKFDRIT